MRRPPATRRAPTRSRRLPRRRSRAVPEFDPDSVAELLSGASATLSCSLIPEPRLLFGDKAPCEDPKTGLTAYGPYSKTDATRRAVIRLGIVGPAEAIDRARALVERMANLIPHNEKHDAMLHPGFPGVNDQDPFQTQFVTQTIWCRTLAPASVARIEHHPDFTVRVQLLIDEVTREVAALSKLDTPPDVVLVAMNAGLEKQCRVGIAQYDREQQQDEEDEEEDGPADVTEDLDENATDEEDEVDEEPVNTARSFRRGLKAACMHLLPTQLLWHRTLAGTKGVQDLATRAWNLSVALLYKARVIPWRLADAIDGSCFVGISFFHPDHQPDATRTSIAQAFTHTGEGFVLQGDKFTWQSTREERSPHLDRDGAAALMRQVLGVYEEEVHAPPQRASSSTRRHGTRRPKSKGSRLRCGACGTTHWSRSLDAAFAAYGQGTSQHCAAPPSTSERRRGSCTPSGTYRSCGAIPVFASLNRWKLPRTTAARLSTTSQPTSSA